MLLLKMKISHNEAASNGYLELALSEGVGRGCTDPHNCQTELVTFKPFLTKGQVLGQTLITPVTTHCTP